MGPTWIEDDHGPLVFTDVEGRGINPARFTAWHLDRVRRVGLPLVDVHGLRHSYATAALRAGVSILEGEWARGHPAKRRVPT